MSKTPSFVLILAAWFLAFHACQTRFLHADEPPSGTAPNWQAVDIPAAWSKLDGGPYGNREYYAWFRCIVAVPGDWDRSRCVLFVEAVDDAREIFFNGQLIGSLGTFPPEYRSGLGKSNRFELESDTVLRGQHNFVAIRVYQNQGRGNFDVAAPVLFGGEQAIRLKGPWERVHGDNLDWAKLSARAEVNERAVFKHVEAAGPVAATLRKLDDDNGPLSVPDTLAQFTLPDDLGVTAVLAEPDIGQPVSFRFDERGRLWVMQFLQYPDPAGLTMLSRDKFLRTVYDRTPPPPPRHFPGADKITIHEDLDEDGRFETQKTFVEGLSLATSFTRGRGGVWVLNPPYLLFYPDRDRDDVPDGEPEVLLEGFGLEDSHSIANSLRWGPDGWLYGCQGSTVTGHIRDYQSDAQPVHSMGQLVWRYHPATRKYEIFAEGGGNSFGLEFDSQGRVFSGHNGGDTRGFHYVQGGYYRKGFGKHGSLSNPYTFGYFAAMKHPPAERFTHDFVIYEDELLPEVYQGRLFAIETIQSRVVQGAFRKMGASFETEDIGIAIESGDKWFRPVDIETGPDGAIYVADFYEQRIDHASHYQGRVHRESGRIYRLAPKSDPIARAGRREDLGGLSSDELANQLVTAKIRWQVQTLLRLIADRRDTSVRPRLMETIRTNPGNVALRAMWALNLSGGLAPSEIAELLNHDNPQIRAWAVRLAADDGQVTGETARLMVELAGRDHHVEVRCQLACSARRLPARYGLPIIRQLLRHDEDVDDVFMPLLIWWAIEAKADSDRQPILNLLAEPDAWNLPMVQQHLVQRLMRRYAATGLRADFLTCAQLLRLAPGPAFTERLLVGFEEAFEGRSVRDLPSELVNAMSDAGGGSLSLRLRQGKPAAVEEALAIVRNRDIEIDERIKYVQLFGDAGDQRIIPVLLELAIPATASTLCQAAVSALGAFEQPEIARHFIAQLADYAPDSREVAMTLLSNRPAWTIQLLNAVEEGRIDAQTISTDVVRKMLLHNDESISTRIREHWGEVQGATTEKMLSAIDRYTTIMATGSGNPYTGKLLFAQSCGKCHQLFGAGGDIGPDLTAYRRDDLKSLLVNVVNPSLEIREGFANQIVYTEDGRTLTGLLIDQDTQVAVLKSGDGQRTVIPREDIEEMSALPQSLMPEEILTPMDDQQIRDLFAYLRATQPLP